MVDLKQDVNRTSQDAACLAAPAQMGFRRIMRQPLPHQAESPLTRGMLRTITWLARHQVVELHGNTTQIAAERDPFIVALNHNQRLEAVLIPSLLFFYRGGKPIHFMADWNFLLMPGVATLYRRSQTIIVTNKKARPAFLNHLKPLFKEESSAFDRALARLRSGAPVGIFPEGTINRDPKQLMRGLPGAARLALLSGAPVIPMGIRFPHHDGHSPIPDGARMSLWIGDALHPPALIAGEDEKTAATRFHAQIMTELTKLSGKTWHPDAKKRRNYVSQ